MDPPYRDAEWLRRKYHEEGLTQREIAEKCGMSTTTIRRWMKRHEIETREIIGENHGLYGKERSDETRRKISESLEGRTFSTETRRRISEANIGREFSEKVRGKIAESLQGIARSEETRRKMSLATAGEKNPNWRGGEFSADWYGPTWTVVRDSIRDRDQVCRNCGHDGSETALDVHHIIPVRNFRKTATVSIEEANNEVNLVLLCRSCHAKAEHGTIEVEPDDPPRFAAEILSLFD